MRDYYEAPLSPEIIERLTECSVELDVLRRTIMAAIDSDTRISNDAGVGNLLEFVTKIQRITIPFKQSTLDTKEIAGELRELIETRHIPCFESLAQELRKLWLDMQEAIRNGAEGKDIIDTWVEAAEVPDEGVIALLNDLRNDTAILQERFNREAEEDAVDMALDAIEHGASSPAAEKLREWLEHDLEDNLHGILLEEELRPHLDDTNDDE